MFQIKNLYPFLVIFITICLLPISQSKAAIDPPRSILVEGGDSQYSLKFWWVNPDNENLDVINLYYSRSLSNQFGKISIKGEQVIANQPGNYLLDNLDINTYYYVYLTAVDNGGVESVPTTISKVRTRIGKDITSPGKVKDAETGIINRNSIKLVWSNPLDNDFYRTLIYRSELPNVPINDVSLVSYSIALPSSEDSFIDESLEFDKTYYYKLISEDLKGNQGESVTLSETTLPKLEEPENKEEKEIIKDQNDEFIEIPEPPKIAPSNIPLAHLFDYQGIYVDQNGLVDKNSDGILTHVVQGQPGSDINMWIKFRNTSRYQWWFENPLDKDNIHEIRLGLTKDQTSQFVHYSWISTNRITKIAEDVLPLKTTTLNFTIHIPEDVKIGSYKLSVGLVAEWIQWIYDDIHWEIRVI